MLHRGEKRGKKKSTFKIAKDYQFQQQDIYTVRLFRFKMEKEARVENLPVKRKVEREVFIASEIIQISARQLSKIQSAFHERMRVCERE